MRLRMQTAQTTILPSRISPRARTKSLAIPSNIRRAIKSGHVPKWRNWRALPAADRTVGEKICAFIEAKMIVPEGELTGEPIRLLPFQEIFIQAIFDGKRRARRAILSVGRKAGKTTITACLLLCFIMIKGLIRPNSRLNSGALSKEQAALVFNYMCKIVALSPELQRKVRITYSGKRMHGLETGIEFQALSAQANTAMGLSPAVLCGDEWGSVVGPSHPFIDALLTASGAHKDPLHIFISTSPASDADWLALQIDDATRNPSDDVVCHYYFADEQLEIDDPKAWEQACPAISSFRSVDDIRAQAQSALRLPSARGAFENLILNRRCAVERLFMSAGVFKRNMGEIDIEVFRRKPVSVGLDLSQRGDLTAAVCAARDDDGVVHLLPFVFCPTNGIEDRSRRDRAPYADWIRMGKLIPIGVDIMDYRQIAEALRDQMLRLEIEPSTVEFDAWRMDVFKPVAQEVGFASMATWNPVRQGFQTFTKVLEAFETLALDGKIRTGGHPLLSMAFGNAIAVQDPAGNRKLDKSRSSARIDPAVAAVMAVYAVSDGQGAALGTDIAWWVG